jgi:hypothetical protein
MHPVEDVLRELLVVRDEFVIGAEFHMDGTCFVIVGTSVVVSSSVLVTFSDTASLISVPLGLSFPLAELGELESCEFFSCRRHCFPSTVCCPEE